MEQNYYVPKAKFLFMAVGKLTKRKKQCRKEEDKLFLP